MPRLAANLSTLFTELPFMERFDAARDAGFTAVEIAYPYEYCLFTTKRKLRDTGLELVLINLPDGNIRLGERGIAANPLRQEEFRAGVDVAVRWARELGVRRVNCLAGVRQEEYSFEQQSAVLAQNTAFAANRLVNYGISLTIDTGNTREKPNWLLGSYDMAAAIREHAQVRNVSLLLRLCQMRTAKEARRLLRKYVRQAGYIRITHGMCQEHMHEFPTSLTQLLREIDAWGYNGFVSMEDRSEASVWVQTTTAGVGFTRK